MKNPITLAIIDDEISFRKRMGKLFQQFEGIKLIWEGGSAQDFSAHLEAGQNLPDIAMVNLKACSLDGINQARFITRNFSDISTILLSSYYAKKNLLHLLGIGITAYLPKRSSVVEIEKTIRKVAEKGFYFNQEVMQIVRENLIEKKKPSMPMLGLEVEGRAKEILQLICEQYTPAEIADKLNLRIKTVEAHREKLCRKFNCRNTAGLVALAIQQNLVEVDSSIFWQKNLFTHTPDSPPDHDPHARLAR